jgi:hypothetical protein
MPKGYAAPGKVDPLPPFDTGAVAVLTSVPMKTSTEETAREDPGLVDARGGS